MDDVIVLPPITIYGGRELPNGDWLHVNPRTEGVLMEVFPADETIATPLSRELLSYDDYAAYREAHPELDLPEFEPPDEEEEEAPIGRQNRSIQSHGGGNTIGRVVGETGATPGPASEANPPPEPETEQEEGFWSRNGEGILDGTQLVLDGAGLIPVVGEVADGINALVSLARGDYAGAALSAAAMIPFAGWGATAAKGVRKGADALEGAGKGAREATEQGAKRANEPSTSGGGKDGKGDGAKTKGRGKCVLRPYRPDTCKAEEKIGHHVVPDRAFRLGGRKGAGRRQIPGGLSEPEGLVICLTRSQHTRVHRLYDQKYEPGIGALGSPPGTASLLALEMAGAKAAASVTGCKTSSLAAQLRAYHQAKGMGPDFKVRANKSGKLTRELSFGDLGSEGPGEF